MKPKIVSLYVLIGLSSFFAGGVFGLLDIFGFIDGRHALSFQLLFLSAALVYSIVVSTFLLNYALKTSVHPFFALCSLLFGIPFFIMNSNVLLAILSMVVYYAFLLYTFTGSHKRSLLYIKFIPTELFFPVLKASFTFFLIFLALITYSQSHDRVMKNNLVSPELISILSKPTIYMLNQQINNQLYSGTSATILDSVGPADRNRLIQLSLEKTLIAMEDPKQHTVYGISTQSIPVKKVGISRDGMVDFAPVFEAILPDIALVVNRYIQSYSAFTPLLVAVFVFFFLQPFIIPLRMIEVVVTLILFRILIRTNFIQITTKEQSVEVPYL